MHDRVPLEVAFGLEHFWALVTLVPIFLVVHPFTVRVAVELSREGSTTSAAHKRLLSIVDFDVNVQIDPLFKSLVADRTGKTLDRIVDTDGMPL